MIPIYQVIAGLSGAMFDRGARVSRIAKRFGCRPPHGREGSALVQVAVTASLLVLGVVDAAAWRFLEGAGSVATLVLRLASGRTPRRRAGCERRVDRSPPALRQAALPRAHSNDSLPRVVEVAFVYVPDPRAETVLELDSVSKVSSHVGNVCWAGVSEPPLKYPRVDQPTKSIRCEPFDRRTTQRVYASDVSRTRWFVGGCGSSSSAAESVSAAARQEAIGSVTAW